MASTVNTGFDLDFGDPLFKFLAAARAQGIPAHIISGVRSDEDQRQLVANAAATRAGRPLPYPARGPVSVAAPVGSSAHESGLAADVQADNPADQQRLIALGTSMGLTHPMSNDPAHFEMPSWRQVASTQPPMTPWDQSNPENVPSAYASNVDAPVAPASAAINQAAGPPGVTLNSTPDRLAQMVGTLESGGGRYSSAQPASMVDPLYGQYPGFAKAYGRGVAGIDNYAQAVLAANPKASVGDFYAGYFSGTGKPGSPNFNNFDLLRKGAIQDTPGTPAAQRAAASNLIQHAGIDPNTPLAAVAGAGPGPGNVGPVTGFLPGASTGQGGIGGDVAAAGNLATQGAVNAPAKPNLADQLTGALKPLQDALKPEQQPQQGADPGQQMLAQEMQAGMAAQQMQQARMAQFAPMMAMLQQKGAQPLHWGSTPPGFGIAGGLIQPPGMPTPTPGGGQVGGGTTLNSMGDFYG